MAKTFQDIFLSEYFKTLQCSKSINLISLVNNIKNTKQPWILSYGL